MKSLLSAALIMCCFCPSVNGDDIKYFPDNPGVVFSVDVAALQRSKTYKEFSRLSAAVAVKLNQGKPNELPSSGDLVLVYRAKKPVTVAEVKAKLIVHAWQKEIVWEETKVGKVSVWQRTCGIQVDKDIITSGIPDWAFCVVEENVILSSLRTKSLKAVLERNKAADLSATMQRELKGTGILLALVDFTRVTGPFGKAMAGQLPVPGVEKHIESVETAVVKFTETDKATITVALVCKNAASAAKIKMAVEEAIILRRAKKVDGSDAAKKMRMLVDAATISIRESEVTATLVCEPAFAAAIAGSFLERFLTSRIDPKD